MRSMPGIKQGPIQENQRPPEVFYLSYSDAHPQNFSEDYFPFTLVASAEIDLCGM